MQADDSSQEMEDWEKQSIYKLHTCIIDLNKKAYIPQAVSFGPYHHGKLHLLPMEAHKERALLHFLKRANIPLQVLIDSLAVVVEDLKSSYAMLPKEWQEEDDKFIQLMILDGCFMLEILRSNEKIILKENADYVPIFSTHGQDYADCDPIFSKHGQNNMLTFMWRDMLMLENQLPMLVLERLLDLAWETEQKADEHLNNLNHLILNLCSAQNITGQVLGECLHVLDVCRKSLLQGAKYQSGKGGIFDAAIPSATELKEAGIRFKNSETETTSLEDISFKHGTLTLPTIVVDDIAESMLLNMIAFERYHAKAGYMVTSYISFMDDIINNEKDVALLQSRGIIQNGLGSEKAVAELFNSLGKDLTVDLDSKIFEVQMNVQNYYNKPWHEWKANLIHTYFRNPWALISLIAAIFLFALTIVQTVYTILPYYENNSPHPPPVVPLPRPLFSRRHGFPSSPIGSLSAL